MGMGRRLRYVPRSIGHVWVVIIRVLAEPDAGIVNFYQARVCTHPEIHLFPTNPFVQDTLMAHVDRSELCATSPLVSISCVTYVFASC